jgi:hypothetical protein
MDLLEAQSKVAAWSPRDHDNSLLLNYYPETRVYNCIAMDTAPHANSEAGLVVSLKSYVVILVRLVHDVVSVHHTSDECTFPMR